MISRLVLLLFLTPPALAQTITYTCNGQPCQGGGAHPWHQSDADLHAMSREQLEARVRQLEAGVEKLSILATQAIDGVNSCEARRQQVIQMCSDTLGGISRDLKSISHDLDLIGGKGK